MLFKLDPKKQVCPALRVHEDCDSSRSGLRWASLGPNNFTCVSFPEDRDSSPVLPRAMWRRNMSWILSFGCESSHCLFDFRVLWLFLLSFLICRMGISKMLVLQGWHKDLYINTCLSLSTLPTTRVSHNDQHENICMYLHCALNYKMSYKANGLSPLENLIHVSIV